ncbi:hypothetical protein [Curtobacterium sp. MCLR17_055]|uniref:hypothetical protein n=1 Tax=Curtobacterium sp. MCLR17_055 TaxID=2175633 RepID=UPI0011B5FE9B|nr:hypothetical protein [Curtobacterium sp. MCLR17_055]
MRDDTIDGRADSSRGRLGVSGIFLVLAFFLAAVTIALGAFWEARGAADAAGGAYAFSAAFVALAITLAATLPARSIADVCAIGLAFAVVYLFGATQNWHLAGWGLAFLLLSVGAVQVLVTRWAVTHDRSFGSASEESPASLRQQVKNLRDYTDALQKRLEEAEERAERAERKHDRTSGSSEGSDRPDLTRPA